MNVIRFLAASLLGCSLGLLVVGTAGATRKPTPRFWTVSHCEQVLLAHDNALPTAEGNSFHAGQTICVGTGGPHACEPTSDHRSRLFSEFTVFTRSRYIGGIVRSFTIATRAGGHGLIRMGHHAGDDYAKYPADFYMSPTSVRLIAPNSTPARFRSIVAPVAAQLTQQENTTGCTGA